MNGADAVHLYDRDLDGRNRRYAMLGQSLIHKLEEGDRVQVRLHKGALKGGDTTTYTSFVGVLLGSGGEDSTGHNII